MSGSGEFPQPGRRTEVESYNNITPVISHTLTRGDAVLAYYLENVVKNCLKCMEELEGVLGEILGVGRRILGR